MSETDFTREQADTLAFLGSPAAHGGEVPRRIDTHLSHIFLTSHRALKLKRALVLDFVDYGSVEKRRTYCERELRANADWAGEIYEAVRPVWRKGNRMGIGEPAEDAEILDWVVDMRRFDDAARGDRLLAAGRLEGTLLDQLADDLADRHAAAPAAPGFGGSDRLARLVNQVSQDIRAGSGPGDPGSRAGAWASSAHAAVARHAALADARAESGRVKPCHGDLHLRNLVLWKGRLVGFDALEFDPDLTRIDVLYDTAFPVMDLVHHGRADLASRLLSRYLAMADDYGGLGLLPLLVSLRAGVRALAAAIGGDGDGADAYLGLAARCLQPAPPPQLIAIGGRSGTGKSTLARKIAPTFAPLPGAIILRSDVLRKRLAGYAPEAPLPPDAYGPGARQAVYAALADRAASILSAGYSCVLDATFLDPDSRQVVDQIGRDHGTPPKTFWLDAPPGTLRARIAGRHHDASDADAAVLERQLSQPAPEDWTRIDVSGSPAEAQARLLDALQCAA